MPWDKRYACRRYGKDRFANIQEHKKQFGGVGVLFHQLDPPVLFPKALLGLLGGGGAGAEYHGY